MNDAVFRPIPGTEKVRVTAEVGWTGCYADDLDAAKAREVYAKLVASGWKPVSTSRRTEEEIAASVNS